VLGKDAYKNENKIKRTKIIPNNIGHVGLLQKENKLKQKIIKKLTTKTMDKVYVKYLFT